MIWPLKLVGITVQAIQSLIFAYLFYVPNFERRFKIITNDTKDLTKKTIVQKMPAWKNWCFPYKYSKIMGFSIRGFELTFPDSKDPIKV